MELHGERSRELHGERSRVRYRTFRWHSVRIVVRGPAEIVRHLWVRASPN